MWLHVVTYLGAELSETTPCLSPVDSDVPSMFDKAQQSIIFVPAVCIWKILNNARKAVQLKCHVKSAPVKNVPERAYL